jgi:murein L,D-transpeptidase YcbB/YkuD
VPASITRKELLPKIRKNPAYLEQHHFEIVRGQSDDAKPVAPTPEALNALEAGQLRLRQRPGPDNALGPVKFVLPNPYEVRLHGTAEPELFDRARRAFSHGCIRVSDPAALAEYVLKDAAGDWNAAAVEAAMCGSKTLRVVLQRPVSVIVFYATAAATVSRGVLFVDDLYGYDSKLQRLLDEQARARN